MLNVGFLRSKRFQRLSKEGFWIVFGQAIAVLGALVGVRVLTELLDPTAYGELALGLTIATLVNQTILGPLNQGTTRFYSPAVERGDVHGYFSAVWWLVAFATGAVVLMILFAIIVLQLSKHAQWIAIAVTALIFAILSGYNSIFSGIQNAARQRSVVALHQGINSWIKFLVAAGLMVILGASSTNAMIGYALATVIVLASQVYFFRKLLPGPGDEITTKKEWRQKIWNFSWPISTFGLFTWMNVISDRWALELFSSTYEVGQYAALYQIGYYPVSLASGLVMQFLSPILYQRAGPATDLQRVVEVYGMSWRLTFMSLVITGVVFLIVLVFHDRLFRIFVAKEYLSVSYLLPWMILAGGIFVSGQTLALGLMSQMKTKVQIFPKISTAVIGVMLNFILAYQFGIDGVVAAAVCFSLLFLFWYIALTIRNHELHKKRK